MDARAEFGRLAPTWRELWRRAVAMLRLRFVTFECCEQCGEPLIAVEGRDIVGLRCIAAWFCPSCSGRRHYIDRRGLRSTRIGPPR